MKSLKRLWVPVLLGILLTATVAGVASARPDARPLQQPWRVLTVPTTHCSAETDDVDFNHAGNTVECESGTCNFVCVVNFPAAGEQAVGAVNVKRLTAYVYDNWGTDGAWVNLIKSYPPTGVFVSMATVQTTTDSPTNPQTIMDTSIVNNPVWRTQGPTIWATIIGSNIQVYGFFIHYTW
jgi:hypothetical protein